MFENIALKDIKVDSLEFIEENNSEVLKRARPPESNVEGLQLIISTDSYIVYDELLLDISLLSSNVMYGNQPYEVWIHDSSDDELEEKNRIVVSREVLVRPNITERIKVPVLNSGYGVVYANVADREGLGKALPRYTISNYLVFYAIKV